MYPLTVGLVIGTKSLWDEVQECLRDLPVRIVLEQPGSGDWAELTQKIDRGRIDLIIVDLAVIQGSMEEAFRSIRTLEHPPVIAALHSEAAPDLILDAVRAGASEFLYPPFDGGLKKALARLADERQNQKGPAHKRGTVLGFLSAKGGCGATTLACHLALELPRMNDSHALLADLDLATGMVSFLMKTHSEFSLADAAKNLHRLDLSFWKKLVSNGNPGLEIITAPAAVSAQEAIGPETIPSIVSFARTHYQWTILDLGRGLTECTLRTLECVDQAFLVTTMEVPALHQTKGIVQRLLDSGFRREDLRLVVNRMTRNPDLTIEELEKALGQEVFATVPNDYSSLHECYSEGGMLPADSQIRRHLATVARRIAGVPEPKQKKRFSLFR